MQSDFQDHHVVVTGAGGALGRAVVRAFLRDGATCHLPLRETEHVGELEHEFAGRFRAVRGVDVANSESIARFYASLPPLWASVHCVGSFSMAPLELTAAGDLERLLAANCLSPFQCTREAVARIRMTGLGGRIVNVAARVGIEPRAGAGMSAYVASKAALAAVTQALGEELAHENIFVNAIAPSQMDTPANRRAAPDADFTRWASIEEVAEVVLWLASPKNRLVRGAIVPVCGRS